MAARDSIGDLGRVRAWLGAASRWLAVLSIVFGLLPVGSALLAGGIAGVLGCRLNEAQAHPCSVLDANIGDLLYAMTVAGWFVFFTVPYAGAGLAVAGIVALGLRLWDRRR